MHTILVIEDEPQSRTMLLDCLNYEGFLAVGAENGAEGIQQAQNLLPDLIICDIVMQELDGYEVLAGLRQQPHTARIPFIFLTAKAGKEEVRAGMNLGADDYLTKPCTADEFLLAIDARLKRQRHFEQHHSLKQLNVYTSSDPTDPEFSDSTNTSTSSPFNFPNCPQLENVFNFIETHYDEAIGLKDIAKAVNYSPAYLTTLVRRHTGQTLHYWLTERRMAAARELLLATEQPICQIATKVGYLDSGHFIRQFRQTYDITPQAWRNQYSQCN